jgi:hypothetical protein
MPDRCIDGDAHCCAPHQCQRAAAANASHDTEPGLFDIYCSDYAGRLRKHNYVAGPYSVARLREELAWFEGRPRHHVNVRLAARP